MHWFPHILDRLLCISFKPLIRTAFPLGSPSPRLKLYPFEENGADSTCAKRFLGFQGVSFDRETLLPLA